MEEVVGLLDECIDRIDELQRRIELMPPWMRGRLCGLYKELEEIRALVVKARMKVRTSPRAGLV